MAVEKITERHRVVDGVALRLSFSPSAIREHFADDEPDLTAGLTKGQLAEAGALALCDDELYATFHRVLTRAVLSVRADAGK